MLSKKTRYNLITFVEERFDAVVCLNTLYPEIDLIKRLIDVPILAADGAAIYLLESKITPNFVIGDLDSFFKNDISHLFPKDRLIYLPDQETNDFEKTLNFARQNNYYNIIVFGIHGGEYEHSLNNWSVLSKYSDIMNIVVYDLKRYGICISRNSRIETVPGETISLIPKGYAKITTEGLQWNLKDELLALGIREGARNLALGSFVNLDISDGELFVFLNSRFPKILKKELL